MLRALRVAFANPTSSPASHSHTVIDLEDWTIQLGVTRRDSFTYTSQKIKVKAVIPHPQYNMAIAHDNDIALFQVSSGGFRQL